MRLRKRTCSPGPCHKYQQAIYEIFWYQFIWGTAEVDFMFGPSCTRIEVPSARRSLNLAFSEKQILMLLTCDVNADLSR